VKVVVTRRPGTTLGLRLQRFSNGVVICGLEEGGLVEQWNTRYPARAVSPGDWLLSANGVPANGTWGSWCAILAELRTTGVELLVLRELRLSSTPQSSSNPPENLDQLLPEGFMDMLPRIVTAEHEPLECSICLQDGKPDDPFVQLPCHHAFHVDCAERWLSQCPTVHWARCPVCRQQIYGDRRSTEAPATEFEAAAPEADSTLPEAAAVEPCNAEQPEHCCRAQCSGCCPQQKELRIKMSL